MFHSTGSSIDDAFTYCLIQKDVYLQRAAIFSRLLPMFLEANLTSYAGVKLLHPAYYTDSQITQALANYGPSKLLLGQVIIALPHKLHELTVHAEHN